MTMGGTRGAVEYSPPHAAVAPPERVCSASHYSGSRCACSTWSGRSVTRTFRCSRWIAREPRVGATDRVGTGRTRRAVLPRTALLVCARGRVRAVRRRSARRPPVRRRARRAHHLSRRPARRRARRFPHGAARRRARGGLLAALLLRRRAAERRGRECARDGDAARAARRGPPPLEGVVRAGRAAVRARRDHAPDRARVRARAAAVRVARGATAAARARGVRRERADRDRGGGRDPSRHAAQLDRGWRARADRDQRWDQLLHRQQSGVGRLHRAGTRPPPNVEGVYETTRRIAEQDVGHPLTRAETSAYWFARGVPGFARIPARSRPT